MLPTAKGNALIPFTPYRRRVKKAFPAQTTFVQQRFRPIAQWPAQPMTDRRAKSHLRAIDQALWDVLIKHLPQQPFSLAIPDLHGHGQGRGKLHDTVIQ